MTWDGGLRKDVITLHYDYNPAMRGPSEEQAGYDRHIFGFVSTPTIPNT